jgi:hypothetical protein
VGHEAGQHRPGRGGAGQAMTPVASWGWVRGVLLGERDACGLA